MRSGLLRNFATIVLVSLYLTGCGGASGTSGTSPGGGSGSSGDEDIPTITLRLLNEDESADITRIDPTNSGVVLATVTNTTGNVIVRFSSTLGVLNPGSGTALTSGGLAKITLESGEIPGAGEVSATISVDGDVYSSNVVPFEVLAVEVVEEGIQLGVCSGGTDSFDCTGGTFSEGDLDISLDDTEDQTFQALSAAGTATINLLVLDTDGQPADDIAISFTSRCTNLDNNDGEPQAAISQETSDANGRITATYQANGCVGADAITAREPSSGESATGEITVESPEVGSIVFDSVLDSAGDQISTIYIQESGGESAARVVFQVLDVFGSPVEDQDVEFELTTTIGGLSLQNDKRKTDADGKATAFVNSGFIATTVRVRASTDVDTDRNGTLDTTLVTLSDQLSVNTGIPDQNSMTIAETDQNPEGEDFVGEESTVSVRLSDAFNNPVRNGTTVQFTTEYGSIQPSCETADGGCSVTWTSQEPRRPLDPTVNVPTVYDGTCPSPFILDEAVTISGTDGNTAYMASAIGRVEVIGGNLTSGTDYTVEGDGSGINCTPTSLCQNGRVLVAEYDTRFIERLTVSQSAGNTTFTANSVNQVQVAGGGAILTEGAAADYTVDGDNTGITCVTAPVASALCTNGTQLDITYEASVENDVITVASNQAAFTYFAINTPTLRNVDFGLIEGTDWQEDAAGLGIDCIAGSSGCTAGANLRVSYYRLWLDEDNSGDTTHVISNPGVATAPFVQKTHVPCTASYRSKSTDASAYLGGLGQVRGGRSSILAHAQGEESFTDANGNGIYDFGEPFVDLPEAFLDVNEDDVYGNPLNGGDIRTVASPTCYGPDAPLAPSVTLDNCYQRGGDEDLLIDFDQDGLFDAGNGIYNGTLCPKAVSDRGDPASDTYDANLICSGTDCTSADQYCTRELVNIRVEHIIVGAGSDPIVGFRETTTGEYVAGFDLTGDPAAGSFESSSSVTRNDGVTVSPGTDFTIGFDDDDVPPGTGERVNLVAGSGGLVVDVSDKFSGVMPSGTGIAVDTESCEISGDLTETVFSSSGFGFSQLYVGLAVPTNPDTPVGTVSVDVITPNAVGVTYAIFCRSTN
jgi:hypothetical protein